MSWGSPPQLPSTDLAQQVLTQDYLLRESGFSGEAQMIGDRSLQKETN